MFEAVNSVVSNTPATKAIVEQLSAAQSASDVVRVAEAPQAPYVSPYIYVNNSYNKAVLQIRDSNTGDVLKQFPSEKTLAQRQVEAERQLEAQNESVAQLSGVSSDEAKAATVNYSGSDEVASASSFVAGVAQQSSATSSAPSSTSQQAATAFISASQSGGAPSGEQVSIQA